MDKIAKIDAALRMTGGYHVFFSLDATVRRSTLHRTFNRRLPMSSPAPCPATVHIPTVVERRPAKPARPHQLRLPGATTLDLEIVAVTIAGVTITPRDGLQGHSLRQQARAAILLGGTVTLRARREVQS
jgi:hypothetical protein